MMPWLLLFPSLSITEHLLLGLLFQHSQWFSIIFSDREALCLVSSSLTVWTHPPHPLFFLFPSPVPHPPSLALPHMWTLPVSSWFRLQVTYVTSPHSTISSPSDQFNRLLLWLSLCIRYCAWLYGEGKEVYNNLQPVPVHEVLSEVCYRHIHTHPISSGQALLVWKSSEEAEYSKMLWSPSFRAQHSNSLLRKALLNYSIFLSPDAHFIRYRLSGIPISQPDSLLFEGRDKHLSIGFSFQFHKH